MVHRHLHQGGQSPRLRLRPVRQDPDEFDVGRQRLRHRIQGLTVEGPQSFRLPFGRGVFAHHY